MIPPLRRAVVETPGFSGTSPRELELRMLVKTSHSF